MRDLLKPEEQLRITKRSFLYDVRGYVSIEKHLADGSVVQSPARANALTAEGLQSLLVALTGESDWSPYPYVLDDDAEMRVLSRTSTERVGWRAVDAGYPSYEEDYRARFQWNIPAGVGTGDWDRIYLRDGTAEVTLTRFEDGYLDWGDKGADEAWLVKYDFIVR